MHLQGAVLRVVFSVPHAFVDIGFGIQLCGMLQEEQQDFIFLCGERQGLILYKNLRGTGDQPDQSVGEFIGVGISCGSAAGRL